MGGCCQPSNRKTAPDRTPSHLRHRQQSSTFKTIRSGKDLSQLAKQRHLYRLTGRRILIYNTDIGLAWAEDLSLRHPLDGHYLSVKTGPNQLFLTQTGLAMVVEVDLLTGIRKPDPPVSIGRSALGYYDRKVYIAAYRLVVFDLETDQWTEIPTPGNYMQESGLFLMENKLYLVGGLRDNQARKDIFVYSLLAHSWLSSTIELPIPMRLPTCIGLDNGQALLCCGFNAQNSPISNAYLFDLFGFRQVPDVSIWFDQPPVMWISYRDVCYVMRDDGVMASWQEEGWRDIDAEGICFALNSLDTVESAGKDGDDLEGLRALIPKRPPRAESLYCYSLRLDKTMVEFNTLSKECREVDFTRFMAHVPKYAGYGLIPGGRVLFAGGVDERQCEVDTSLEYDGAAQSLMPAMSLPSPQAFIFTCVATERLYALGSHASSYSDKAQKLPVESFLQEYSAAKWVKLPPPEHPMLFASICHLGGALFTFGGVTKVDMEYVHSLIFEFSLSMCTWRRLTPTLPASLGWLSTVNTTLNRILLFGGEDLSTRQLSTVTWSFDGKGFKTRQNSSFRGRTCLCVVRKDTGKPLVYAVDMVGVGHSYSPEAGQWQSV